MLMSNWTARFTMIAALFTGPVFTQVLATRNMSTYSWEWPATWCYMSVGQCVVALTLELVDMMRKEGNEAKEIKNDSKERMIAPAGAVTSDAKAVVNSRKGHVKHA